MDSTGGTPANWYPDSQNPGQERYWDGQAWTAQTRPQQQTNAAPQQPAYYQHVPPKRSHTLRNVLLVLTLLAVLGVGGCFAVVGIAANSVNKDLKQEEANDQPTAVQLGEAFDHDGYHVDAGWKLGKKFGYATITGINITNVKNDDLTGSDAGRTALLTFRLYKGTQNLAEISCNGKELQEGESSSMDCSSTDKLPTDYDAIKVADLF